MLVNFTKMHGLGNDFVVIDLMTQSVKLQSSHIQRIADRHTGIGCDQVLLIEPPIRPEAHFYYRIFNADGQEVEQCGNGARCVARFFYDAGYTNTPTLKADCLAGPIEFTIAKDNSVTVNLGRPRFHPKNIPFIAEKESLYYPITIEDTLFSIQVVSMGNPHAILQVPEVGSAPLKKIGPLLSKDKRFPKEANVGFMQIIDRTNIRLRVYERGLGETLSCGSAAAAAVVAGIRANVLDNAVNVAFLEGKLHISWVGNKEPVYMSGPAVTVFIGRFRL